MLLQKQPKKVAFTLIEIIIAIMIFSVGIMVLLRAVVYFLSMGNDARLRAQATLLGKEAMDIVFNQRDTNMRRGVIRNCAILKNEQGDCANFFEPGKSFVVGFNGKGYEIKSYTEGSDAGLYIMPIPEVPLQALSGSSFSEKQPKLTLENHPTNMYVLTDSKGTPTPFKRIVTIEKATLKGKELSSDHVVKVKVTIQYMPDHPDRAVVLETYLAAGEKVD